MYISSDDPTLIRNALELFEREAKTLAKLDHPQIPKLLDYFEYQQNFYLIQEFILGKDLEKEVRKKGLFLESTAKRFLQEMLPVLQYIHSQKVIHLDLKPGNIIRKKEDNRLFLIDFGAVKAQVNTRNEFIMVTSITGFVPPEQLALRTVYASDIYALGATCLYLLTGKPPQDLPCNSIIDNLLWEQEIKLSDSLAQILRKMLQFDIRDRYQSAEEVIKELDIALYERELAVGMSDDCAIRTSPHPTRAN